MRQSAAYVFLFVLGVHACARSGDTEPGESSTDSSEDDGPVPAGGSGGGRGDDGLAGFGGSSSPEDGRTGGAAAGAGESGAGAGTQGGAGGALAQAGEGGSSTPISSACAALNNGSGTTVPCATTSGKTAVCFGTSTPVTLKYQGGADVMGVAQVTAKGFTEEACVRLETGAVHCGRHDQISNTPIIASGAKMVSAGLTQACAIVGQEVQCWESNSVAVVKVAFGAETPTQLACYYHGCCAVTASGKLVCWGENSGGMHGTGDQTNHPMPTSPKTVPGKAIHVGPGQDHMCAVFEGGKVQCWGQDWNAQLGGKGASSDPGVTLVDSGAAAVVGGQFHTCVLMATGTVRCTSSNQTEGAGLDKGMLTDVAGITDATALTAGKHYTCARLGTAKIKCWGKISGGTTPIEIAGVTAATCR